MKQLITGFFALLLSVLTTQAIAQTKPDYTFDEFKSVSSIRSSDVNGWGRINDQVLIVRATPSKRYMLVLTRPDHDIAYSNAIGVTSNAGRVMAKFDGVYAGRAHIHIKVPIQAIYELNGKEELEKARALVKEREQAAKDATNKDSAKQ